MTTTDLAPPLRVAHRPALPTLPYVVLLLGLLLAAAGYLAAGWLLLRLLLTVL